MSYYEVCLVKKKKIMVEIVKTSSVNINSNSKSPKYNPQFKGGNPVDILISAVQMCEANPMVNVAVLDLSTAIVPRTVVEGETNPYAGFEAFRRESSGLIINCIIPGLIVAAIAKGVQPVIMGKGSNMSDCLANEDTINLVSRYWERTIDAAGKPTDAEVKVGNESTIYPKGSQKAKIYNTLKMIKDETTGKDGETDVEFKKFDFHESLKTLTESVSKENAKDGSWWARIKANKAENRKINTAIENMVKLTHASENIKIAGHVDKKNNVIDEYFSQSFESVSKNAPKIIKELINGTKDAAKGGITVEQLAKKATTLLNTKSLLGLGVVIPLALSAQPINRWITAKTSGKKGAPIYKDFSETQSRELTKKEKSALFKQKIISVGSMVGVALLSMSMGGKLPGMKVLQFKSLFPTMDQARLISTATFASRMMASEDKNDLREATVRDIATFSAFYFLGDYVAKGIASGIQHFSKKGLVLINDLDPLKPGVKRNLFETMKHWTKDTALKSSEEVVGTAAKRMRSVCQLGNIAFSLVSLGLLIPMMNRKKTDKQHEAELKQKSIKSVS
jgi:hypothetical protein